jgi:single-strand DNA-binding protein
VNETWVTVVGNVASDVSWRRTQNGGEVANFRVMSTERRFDAESASWEDGLRVAVRVNCWRRLGENVRACITKGDPVVVRGRLSVREYEVDGVRRTSTEIEARTVALDLARVCAKVVPTGSAGAGRPVADVTGLVVVDEGAPRAESDDLGTGSPVGAPLVGSGVGEPDADEDDGTGLLDGPALAS